MFEIGDRVFEQSPRHVRKRPILRRRLPFDALAKFPRNAQNDLLVVVNNALHAVRLNAAHFSATHQDLPANTAFSAST
jgi:hypothetical protein